MSIADNSELVQCMKILFIDDQILLCEAVIETLSKDSQFEEIRIASSLKESINLIQENIPDIILLDINFGEQSGFNMLSYIKHPDNAHLHSIKIIVLTSRTDKIAVSKSYRLGAKAYLDKTCHISELRNAIETVSKGGEYFSEELRKKINESKQMIQDFSPDMLSNRENEVLNLLCESLTSKEIASHLRISFNTVNIYRKNLLHKFGVNNTSGLVKIAMQNGLYH